MINLKCISFKLLSLMLTFILAGNQDVCWANGECYQCTWKDDSDIGIRKLPFTFEVSDVLKGFCPFDCFTIVIYEYDDRNPRYPSITKKPLRTVKPPMIFYYRGNMRNRFRRFGCKGLSTRNEYKNNCVCFTVLCDGQSSGSSPKMNNSTRSFKFIWLLTIVILHVGIFKTI